MSGGNRGKHRQAKLHRGLELARQGMTYDEIARELGYANRSGVWKLLRGALRAAETREIEDHRLLEIGRLDRLQVVLWDKALTGDRQAVDAVLRVIRERIRLLGLDHPEARAVGEPVVRPIGVSRAKNSSSGPA